MINYETKKPYTKTNLEILMVERLKNSYKSIEWATYLQWRNAGRVVTKGQRGIRLVRMGSEVQANGSIQKKFKKSFCVFNLDQTETLVERETTEGIEAIHDMPSAERLAAGWMVDAAEMLKI